MFRLTRDEQLAIAVGLLIISIIAIVIFFNRRESVGSGAKVDVAGSNASVSVSSNIDESESQRMIYVHVSGAVLRPNVYRVGEGTRVFNIIWMAGLKPNADPDRLSLASLVHDGEKIVVPKRGGSGEVGESHVSSRVGPRLIDINTASQRELEMLSGIGPVYAQRIIDYRASYPFERIEDIIKVKGIGQATFEDIKDKICVE